VTTTRRHLLFGALGATLLTGCDKLSGTKTGFKAIDITGADYGKSLSLPDQTGKTRTLADFKGKVTVVFFGFTQCPDVCPTTMAELAQIKKGLGLAGEKLQGVFITVDPERDTPERLQAYMQGFDPSFIALRGTPEQTAAVAKDFRVYYAKVPGKGEGSYTMDHTAGSYIFDASGRLRLFTRYGDKDSTANLTADLKTLLAEA
jgi:protein SCO1/2